MSFRSCKGAREATEGEDMGIFRKPLLYGGTACLAFLLSAALIPEEKVQWLAYPKPYKRPRRKRSSSLLVCNDEYHKQWSRAPQECQS